MTAGLADLLETIPNWKTNSWQVWSCLLEARAPTALTIDESGPWCKASWETFEPHQRRHRVMPDVEPFEFQCFLLNNQKCGFSITRSLQIVNSLPHSWLLSCTLLSLPLVLCHAMSSHVMSCHVMSCHPITCRLITVVEKSWWSNEFVNGRGLPEKVPIGQQVHFITMASTRVPVLYLRCLIHKLQAL